MFDFFPRGDRPLLLWSMALGMLSLAFVVSLAGLHPEEDLASAFFRIPFIIGLLAAAFVMGFVRPEMRFAWTIGMGCIPAAVLLTLAQIRVFVSPDHNAGEPWAIAVLLALALGLSLAFAGSSIGATTALRISRY